MFDSVFFIALYPVFVSFAFFADMVVEELELDVGAVLVFPSFFFFDGVVMRAKECFALFGGVYAFFCRDVVSGGLPIVAMLAYGV